MLTAKTDSEPYVEAANAAKGVDYACRGCARPVIFKSGRVRTPHFAHYPSDVCAFGALMSPEHLRAQNVLAAALRARGANVELEAVLNSLAGDRRIDVLAWPKDRTDPRIAIEVQASDMTIELIEARTRSYHRANIAPLWLRLYDFGKWKEVKRLEPRGTIYVEKHQLRSWERWAYEHLGPSLWFMDSRTFLLWRGTFAQAYSYQQESHWYTPEGDEQSAGGYYKPIKQWTELALEGPFEADALIVKRETVKGPDRKLRQTAVFLAPDEARSPAPQVRTRVHFDRTNNMQYMVHEVCDGSNWSSARMAPAPDGWRRG